MLIYLSITGIILSVILLYFNARSFKSSIYLGIFFFVVSLYGINQYALLYSKSVLLTAAIITNISFTAYLIGPMLYLYIRSILSDNPRMKKRDFLHFFPMLVYLAAALPYIFTSWSYKTEIATAIVNDVGIVDTVHFTVLSDIFSNTAIYLSRPVLALGYTLWSIGYFILYLRGSSVKHVFSGQFFMVKWLSFLLGFQLLMVVSHLVSVFETFFNASNVFFTVNILQILSGAGMIGLLISPLFFPVILYGLPRYYEQVVKLLPDVGPVEMAEQETEEEELIREHNFESEYILLIEHKTAECMREFRPYLQPDLNLNRFSEIIQIPAHHLGYYFRAVKKQSFNDYSNECRVEYAKTLILDGKTEDVTLEAIGILSGFSNRSTFMRAFKKKEGTSPGSFYQNGIQKS